MRWLFNLIRSLTGRRRDLEDENRRLKTANSELAKSYDITIEALGDVLDLKAASPPGHSRCVTAFSIAIAAKMGLRKDEVGVIARGVFLHEIGKIAIPDRILHNQGELTAEETLIMHEHVVYGYKFLKKIPFLEDSAEIVYSQHERYDGSGHPRGLKGEAIPLGARILAVANTFDSLTSDLPLAAQTIDAARREIAASSGRHFDPEIVTVFLGMPDALWRDLRQSSS
jgi:HD-GYP domain-containing protein (c-di-GMP phosphodiesterase class II)